MNWLISNIDVIIGVIVLVCMLGVAVYNFIKMGKEKQIVKIKEWLLYAVIESEKALGEKTGQVKLRYCYDMFLNKFKFMSLLLTFEQFSAMVDEALDRMRDMLAQNEKLKELVEGKEDKGESPK